MITDKRQKQSRSMIELNTMRLFVSTHPDRVILSEPRVINGVMVATDGRVIVEVPVREVDFDLEELEVIPGTYPHYLSCFDMMFPDKKLVPMEPPVVSERPDGARKCFACRGMGRFVCRCPDCKTVEHECQECAGKGALSIDDQWLVRCGEVVVFAGYVQRIEQLPNVRWYRPIESNSAVLFHFGAAGRGMLMPVQPPK
jgi:hypothetical protein